MPQRALTLFCLLILNSMLPVSRGADLVSLDTTWRFFAGQQEASSAGAWRLPDFDDSGWPELNAPFWYGDPQPAPGTELGAMQGNYSSIFLRRSFVVADPTMLEQLELGAQSDDGFIAWLNGVEIGRFNMPMGDIPYNGSSLEALPEPVPFQRFTILNPSSLLVPGVNTLAVHAFNSSLGASSDFVINVTLQGDADVIPPVVQRILPGPGRLLNVLSEIEVVLSEPVSGVDAADLLINGMPATNVIAFTGGDYLFQFPQPSPGLVHLTWRDGHGIADLAQKPNPLVGEPWSYTLDPQHLPEGLHISEFMAANSRTIKDRFGDDSDWIEIFNGSSAPVNLQGWALTDSATNPFKWRFPSVTLQEREYLLVFASGRNETNTTFELHTNFKLGREGSYLALVSPSGQIASAFAPVYPPQQSDVSYGRDINDPQIVGYFIEPTPGWPNSTAGAGFAPAVQFSAESRAFASPFHLNITPVHSTGNVQIRYTLDGSPVHSESPLYLAPIPITQTARVSARAFQPGLWPGPQETQFYFELTPEAANFVTDLPIMVLHNEGWGEVPAYWDQPVLVQTYEPVDGVTSLTNRPTLSSHAIFHLRGSSTLYYPKGSYFLETQDPFGMDQSVSLLGLPSESDWVLYAPNNFEPVLIHNPVALALSRQMGRYASRTRYCVVFLNTGGGAIHANQYRGIYVLEEKIKVDKDRVAIDKLGPQDLQPPAVTGGYLLSVDRSAPGEWPIYAGDQLLNVLAPNFWDLMSSDRFAQYQYLQNYFDSFFNALTGPNWRDPDLGYAAYIDVPAAIDHHIHGVVTFNVDALRLSGYLYKPREGKIMMGPVWDFDRTQGSTDGRDFNPRTWRSRVGDRGTDMFRPADVYHNPWYGRMFLDPDFWQQWVDRYQALRDTTLSDANVHAVIDAYADPLRKEQPREASRWGIRPRAGQVTMDGFSHVFSGSYSGEVDWMKVWYSERLHFIDDNLLARPQLSLPPGPVAANTLLTLSSSEPGTIYYTLNGEDPRLPGGDLSPGAGIYAEPILIRSNVHLVARTYNPQHRNQTGPGAPPLSTPWSGRSDATYVVATPSLVISEIMYHPAPDTTGQYDDNDYEFVELLNRGPEPVPLPGVHFANGITFKFDASTPIPQLAPGERLVLVKNLMAFQSRYPTVNRIGGVYVGSLDNSGERLALAGSMLETISDFRYEDTWVRTTDGLGFSLVLADESVALDALHLAGSWRASRQQGGSPGLPEPASPSIPRVLITEALTHTDPPDQDAIELHNPETTAADISGWWLTDDPQKPQKYRIPPATVIPAGGYRLFTESQFTNQLSASFRLSSLGDSVYVFSTDGGTHLTGYVHGYEYGASFNRVPFGRHITSVGAEYFVAQTSLSLGAVNPGPRVGPVVINEIMADPALVAGAGNAALDEYVELYNPGPTPVLLFDPLAPTNTWRIRGGIGFDFPPNFTLAPDRYVLVVSFSPELDPAKLRAFRDHYSLPATVAIVGPFTGRLANEGDRVTLLQPDTPQGPDSAQPGFVPYVLVDAVDYGVQSPWPPAPTTVPASLQRRLASFFGNDPAHWESAVPTPGALNRSSGTLDTDGDGLPDVWESQHQLDPLNAEGADGALGDPDQDGLSNAQEWAAGTDPRKADTDGDGLLDGWEVSYGLNPLNRSGIHSSEGDPDQDGLTNADEQLAGTHPLNPDSDGDWLSDAWEIAHDLDPNDATGIHGRDGDPDMDSLTNYHEFLAGTQPWNPASSLRLHLERRSDGRLYIEFATVAGRGYLLQSRNSFDQPWVTMTEIAALLQDSRFQLLTGAQGSQLKFYRVMLRP